MSSLAARRPVVWIVDDSPTERLISERSLGNGFDITHCGDGSEVVERLAGGAPQPDVILLDWVMPGMSGPEVCKFMRANPATRELPIILVTASRVETQDVVAGLALGANDYVARPFAPEELRARVQAILRTKELADAARRERQRVDTVNRLGRALFAAGPEIDRILHELASALTESLCDGCSILLLPGDYPQASVIHHRADPSGAALAAISSVADPTVFAFDSDEHALHTLPPTYHPFIRQFGLHGLAILPFPSLTPIQGVVTVTRERAARSFSDEDIATIATCIEYSSLAVQNVLRFDAERLARAQLHAVFDHAPLGIVVAEPSGALTLCNPAAARLLPGIEGARDLAAVFALARWRSAAGEPLAEAEWLLQWYRPGVPEPIDLIVEHDGGDPCTLSVTTVPLTTDGNVAGSVTTIEDVTAIRAIDAERERVAGFQQQMLGIVSHDLRNPLGAIVAGVDVIEMRTTAMPNMVPVVRRMRSSAGRMVAIIEQLLDVTRARLGGGIPVALRPTSLRQIVQGVVDEFALANAAAVIELHATDEVEGVWDPDRLAQVVSNLVANAAHYGDIRKPIVVEVTGTDGHGILTVTNAVLGEPIPAEHLELIFDPYAREGVITRNARGLGLGLYIVSEVVRAHRGTIVATSTPAGTTFRVTLPRATRS